MILRMKQNIQLCLGLNVHESMEQAITSRRNVRLKLNLETDIELQEGLVRILSSKCLAFFFFVI